MTNVPLKRGALFAGAALVLAILAVLALRPGAAQPLSVTDLTQQ